NFELHMLLFDSEGSVRPWRAGRNVLKYKVLSDIAPPTATVLKGRGDAYPDYVRNMYLGTTAISERTCNLATRVTTGLDDPYDKAVALVHFLKTNYEYTLKGVPPPRQSSKLDYFLFERKKGHCEYFATALTAMLRCAGVPARVSTGFVSGEWNEYGSYLAFSEADAHAWTEAFFPGYGWARFDATPASSHRRISPVITKLYDMLRQFWYRHVVEYDLGAQLSFLHRLAFKVNLFSSNAGAKETTGGKSKAFDSITAALIIGCLSILLFFLLKKVPFKRNRAPRRTPGRVLLHEMEKILAKQGIKRSVSETPAKFVERACTAFQDPGDTLFFIKDIHQHEVYGGREIDSMALERAKVSLKRWAHKVKDMQ
ncbi:MAG: transglutaminase domain-containing protein, partial [Deltaproteobacteria bacterium]|nr:transglutaminase domain-containing protein [Deltaproteobacteria bacterium]